MGTEEWGSSHRDLAENSTNIDQKSKPTFTHYSKVKQLQKYPESNCMDYSFKEIFKSKK